MQFSVSNAFLAICTLLAAQQAVAVPVAEPEPEPVCCWISDKQCVVC